MHSLTLRLSLFSFFDTSRGEICTAPMSGISSYIEMSNDNDISTYIVIRNGVNTMYLKTVYNTCTLYILLFEMQK